MGLELGQIIPALPKFWGFKDRDFILPQRLVTSRTVTMTEVHFEESLLSSVKDKVVIVTGGASGIGRATVELFHRHGAYVVFGDVNDDEGIQFEKTLGTRCVYIRTDVQSWSSLSTLFQTTLDACRQIDIVVANAGLQTTSFWKDTLDTNGDLQEPDWRVIDTNLKGIMATVKLSLHYFQKNTVTGGRCVIVGSPDGYFRGSKQSGPIAEYVATEHGIIGFLRASSHVFPTHRSQISAIAPWLTKTTFTSKTLLDYWTKNGLPLNTPEDVAKAIIIAALKDMNGKCIFVAGGDFVEIEEKLQHDVQEWLGQKIGAEWKRGISLLNSLELSTVDSTVDSQGSTAG